MVALNLCDENFMSEHIVIMTAISFLILFNAAYFDTWHHFCRVFVLCFDVFCNFATKYNLSWQNPITNLVFEL